MKFLKADMKRAFGCPGFWIATAALLVIFFRAIHINTNPDGGADTYDIIATAMALSGYTPFAAIFPSLGYSVAFCGEYNSGYIRMITSRMSWKRYAATRMLSVGTAGGVTIALPTAAVCLAGWLLGTYHVPAEGFYAGTPIQTALEHYGDAYVLVGKVALGFFFGAMWALVGLAFSVWLRNRYVSLIAPFVLYETMWMLLYNYPLFNPIYMLRGDDLANYPLSGAMELLYVAAAAIVVWFGMKRRLRYE